MHETHIKQFELLNRTRAKLENQTNWRFTLYIWRLSSCTRRGNICVHYI